MDSFLPESTRFVASLRNPSTRSRSEYNYFNIKRRTNVSFDEYASRPGDFRHGLGHNTMLYYFGEFFADEQLTNVSYISDVIRRIERGFDLVMIFELFDESLLMLRKLLCWTWDDVLLFKHNEVAKTLIKQQNSTLDENFSK